METIKIKYHADIDKLEKITVGDLIDLRAAEDVFIPLCEMKLVSLGVSMKLPDGYRANLYSRSSLYKNYGLFQVNSVGIIDQSYCGNDDVWKIPLCCLDSKDVINHEDGTIEYGTWIRKNDRIAQFEIIAVQPKIEFEEVDKLDDENRSGFGSTGVA